MLGRHEGDLEITWRPDIRRSQKGKLHSAGQHADDGVRRGIKIDDLVDDLKTRCLVESGSLLFPDRSLWTIPHLEDFRARLIENPVHGSDQNFWQKLAGQLETAEEDRLHVVDPLGGEIGHAA